jgi:hypothetical protein
MSGFRYRCPLGRPFPERPDPEDIKREGWRDQGILVISPEDQRLNWMERQLLTQIAERLYGRRKVSHG